MARNKVVMEVSEIKGVCPMYAVGDQIVIEPVPGENVSVIKLKETTRLFALLSWERP